MSQRYQAGIVLPGYNALKVANAPTIGTATAGVSSVSVAFTAPADVGGGAITGYTVQSIKTSDGSLTLTNGASSPITVSGLTIGSAYTFKVFATNVYGPSPLSAASNSATPTAPVIGQAYQGGYYGGSISTSANGIADFYLVVGPLASAQSTTLQWKTSNTSTSGTTSVINGPANSAAMNDASHPAAQFCEAVTAGGYTDWYMPAINESEVCYYNLKPSTDANTTASGANPNAVPARGSNYTTGNPAQTSATIFQTGNSEPYSAENYWTSTQVSATTAWRHGFNTGLQYADGKNFSYRVRAIRRVAV